MDLRSGYPRYTITNGLQHPFLSLHQEIRCEVAVVGGGISGALIANELASHGHDVAVLEERSLDWAKLVGQHRAAAIRNRHPDGRSRRTLRRA